MPQPTSDTRTDMRNVERITVIEGTTASAEQPLVIAESFDLGEYTDERFHADLEQASVKLLALEQQAVKDHKAGKSWKLR